MGTDRVWAIVSDYSTYFSVQVPSNTAVQQLIGVRYKMVYVYIHRKSMAVLFPGQVWTQFEVFKAYLWWSFDWYQSTIGAVVCTQYTSQMRVVTNTGVVR